MSLIRYRIESPPSIQPVNHPQVTLLRSDQALYYKFILLMRLCSIYCLWNPTVGGSVALHWSLRGK